VTDSSNFRDPELRRQLGALGGAEPDVPAARTAVGAKVRRARRVRAAAFSACGVLMVGGVAAAGIGGRGNGTVAPAATSADTAADTSADTSVSPSSVVSTSAAPDTTLAGADTSVATGSSEAPTTSVDTSEPGTSLPADTSVLDATATFSGVGGSIVVRSTGSGVELVSSSPAAGFSADIRSAAGDKVEVRFRSDSHRTKIEVRMRNGALSPKVDENSEGSDGDNSGKGGDDSTPENTTPRSDDDNGSGGGGGSGGGDDDDDSGGDDSGGGDGDNSGSGSGDSGGGRGSDDD
jgi:hypothetical protein